MTDIQSLLQAIIANPDEDTPRLMYADALDELGGEANAERARLIRHQCAERPTLPPGCEDRDWLDRHGAVAEHYLARDDTQWRADLGAPVDGSVWLRGFIEHVSLNPTAYCRYGRRLHAGTPLRRVCFGSRRAIDIGRLVGLPHFARLSEIVVGGCFAPGGIAPLAASESVRPRRLELHRGVTADDVRRIERSAWAPGLGALTVGTRLPRSGSETTSLLGALCGEAFLGLRELRLNEPFDGRLWDLEHQCSYFDFDILRDGKKTVRSVMGIIDNTGSGDETS